MRSLKEPFTVTIGTIMEDSHLPIRKWLMAFSLMCASKKGISALQLKRSLAWVPIKPPGTYAIESAWR